MLKQIVLFLLVLFINESTCDLLGNVLDLSEPLFKTIGLRKGSKLSLLGMLSNTISKTPDGGVISDGDIVVHTDRNKGVKEDGDLWPNGLIPYMFHNSIDKDYKQLVIEAMKHWEENTCIRFRRKNLNDKHFIRFRADTSGCWSSVGRQYDRNGPQDISLGSGCFKFFTAVHEIGHSIGYYHEHARRDRDQFIEILWDNVRPGTDVQFEIKDTRNEGDRYDLRSIMHYPAWAFSKSPLNKSVIVAKNPFVQYLIDEEKESLSFRDIKLTNKLYKCNRKCRSDGNFECKNNGYLMYNRNDKICSCICPPGYSGILCEDEDTTKTLDYLRPKCGGNITKEGTFSTPNYPLRKQPFESCSYWIRAPVDHRVEVTFEDFSFGDPYSADDKHAIQGLCLDESVEMRNFDDIYNGNIYCGQQIKPKSVMQSTQRNFIIIIIADDQMRGRGLKASVRFIENEDKTPKPQNTKKPKNRLLSKSNSVVQSQVFKLLQGLSLK